jgi:hypothetical protein
VTSATYSIVKQKSDHLKRRRLQKKKHFLTTRQEEIKLNFVFFFNFYSHGHDLKSKVFRVTICKAQYNRVSQKNEIGGLFS